MKTIHRRLLELLDHEEEDNAPMTAKDLCSLEREAYIFCALVGGNTGKSVLISAVKEFGNPESAVYHLKNSEKHFADLLQLLKIVVRGVAFIGNSGDSAVLEYAKNQLNRFAEFSDSIHENDLIIQIRELLKDGIVKTAARP